jgi:hypothetical protein
MLHAVDGTDGLAGIRSARISVGMDVVRCLSDDFSGNDTDMMEILASPVVLRQLCCRALFLTSAAFA